jgi:fructose-bisphosphate aldolase class II
MVQPTGESKREGLRTRFAPRKFSQPSYAEIEKVCINYYEAFGAAGQTPNIKALPLKDIAGRYPSGKLDSKIS